MDKNPATDINCAHSLIDDSGTSVCILCGIVVNMFSFNNDVTLNESKNCFSFYGKVEFLNELYNRNIISLQVNFDAEKLVKKWHEESIPHKKYHQAFAVYTASVLNNFPLTLKEISYHFNQSIKNICKIEKYVKTKIQQSPFDFLEKFCKLLNFSFCDEKIIEKNISRLINQIHAPPSHITAHAIILAFPKIDHRLLSDVTMLPVSTIIKIMKKCARSSKNV